MSRVIHHSLDTLEVTPDISLSGMTRFKNFIHQAKATKAQALLPKPPVKKTSNSSAVSFIKKQLDLKIKNFQRALDIKCVENQKIITQRKQ